MSVSLICKHTRIDARREKTLYTTVSKQFLRMQMRTAVDFSIFAAVFRERLCKFLFTVRDNILPTRCSTWNENNFPHGMSFFTDSHARHSFSCVSIILIFRTRWCLFIPPLSPLVLPNQFYAQFRCSENSFAIFTPFSLFRLALGTLP